MHPLIIAGLLAGFAGDAATTTAALQRGAHELVLTQSAPLNVAIIGGEATAVTFTLQRYHHEHPRAANVLAVVMIATRVLAIGANVHAMRR